MSASVYTNFAAESSPKKTLLTEQTSPIPGREAEQKLNNAGGYSFVLDSWGVLDRFLVIGSEGGGAYATQKDVTKMSFTNTLACIEQDGLRAVAQAVEYSISGRAPKNDPALIVLALAAAKGSAEVQAAAYAALPKVARIGTHLFTFVSVLNSLGKWNSAAKRGVASWYTNRGTDRLAVQLIKYQQRNGWSHRDVLRLAHVKPTNDMLSNIFKYVTKGADALEQGSPVPQLFIDFERLKRAKSKKEVIRLIESNKDISWELVPTHFLKEPDVLMALVPAMGLTATIRFLGRLSAAGVLNGMSEGQKLVVAKLSNAKELRKQRLHPVTILQSMKQYSTGHGEKGSLAWLPNQRVVDVLDNAFYASFENSEDTGRGNFVAIDCSGSMFWNSSKVIGSPNLVAADVAACMALGIVKKQSNYMITAFGSSLTELKISPNMRLDSVLKVISSSQMGGTDCALPMRYAENKKIANVDLFTVITDNETHSGHTGHPLQTLASYRKKYNPLAKLAVMATSVSEFTIADPLDGGMLDIAGFDSATPAILADFSNKGYV